jgi:microcystin degradation protein MlrC
MKFFFAMLGTETNTFAGAPTGRRAFEEYGIYRGDASEHAPQGLGAFPLFVRRMLEADGHEMVESVCAAAQPGGPTVRAVYEELRDAILEDLRVALPVDAVLLMLHGAMVADGYDDCEGDLLTRVREIVGPGVPVGAELDLHCHYTASMHSAADVIIAFKEYPHVDGEARARELYSILRDCAAGRVRPVTAVFDVPIVGLWPTTREPMQGFVKRMQSIEGSDGVLSVSLGHGFPWGDVPDASAKVWVITDDDLPKAQALAEQLAREFWDLRESTSSGASPLDAALDQAMATLRDSGGPVVIGDVADNPGGGAPGDATFILQRLIERGIPDAVLGVFWDLGAVHICRDAGVGARVALRVGGKVGPSSGTPVDMSVRVRAVVEDHDQAGLGAGRLPFGTCVWVESLAENGVPAGLHLLIASVRCQVVAPDAFTGLGLSLADKKLVIVKSTQHFHALFAPIAKAVLYASTPGAITPDFRAIPYRKRSLNYWPRVALTEHSNRRSH